MAAWDHVVAGGMTGQYAQVFCAAKGGVYSFSRVLARTVAPHIRVNVIAPGWVETEYGETLDPAVKQRITTGIPLQRWARPEEGAAAAVFLASDRAGYITGQMLMINARGRDTAHPTGGQMATERTHLHRSGDPGQAQGPAGLVGRGWLDSPHVQDRQVADDSDAGEFDRLHR
jgi:hypothetical protein